MNISHAIRTPARPRAAWLMGLALLGSHAWHAASAQQPIAAGFAHSCSINGGRLSCWGNNDFGQLGDGTTRSKLLPVAVSAFAEPVDGVAAGDQHTCAISNGALSCWGSNGSGQLGNGSSGGQSLTPAAVGGLGSGVSAVAAGRAHTCAIVDQGLKCWGANQQGQLGTGDTQPHTTPVDVFPAFSGVTSVTAGSNHTCVVKSAIAYCWGDNSSGQLGTTAQSDPHSPAPVAGLGSAFVISAGEMHSCALLDTAKVMCWGDNSDGQLGDGTTANSPSPVTVSIVVPSIPPVIPLSGIGAIDAGSRHTCATGSGRVYCWGLNELGQIGDGTTANARYAVRVPAFDGGATVVVVAGGAHTCASENGTVYCWGNDQAGQVGDFGTNVRIPYPVPIPALDDFGGIDAGASHACATNGSAYCWGANESGQIGDDSTADRSLPVVVTGLAFASVTAIAAGESHSCAIAFAGSEVRCWGQGQDGQLGNDAFFPSSTPVIVNGLTGTTITAIDSGDDHTCAAVDDGVITGARCWGKNDRGQLGSASNDPMGHAVNVFGNDSVRLNGVASIAAGGMHSCALLATQSVRCWGANDHGELGNDSTDDWNMAYPVTGLGNNSGTSSVAAGGAHTCAVVNHGVKCWGLNAHGQLGDGTHQERHTPVTVYIDANQTPLSSVSEIATGVAHTCAVSNGGVLCWGDNSMGQLGDGTFVDSSLPVTAIPPVSGIVAVTAGADYTCATTGQNRTWCWGNGLYGRLANGSLGYMTTPVPVDFDTILRSGFQVLVP